MQQVARGEYQAQLQEEGQRDLWETHGLAPGSPGEAPAGGGGRIVDFQQQQPWPGTKASDERAFLGQAWHTFSGDSVPGAFGAAKSGPALPGQVIRSRVIPEDSPGHPSSLCEKCCSVPRTISLDLASVAQRSGRGYLPTHPALPHPVHSLSPGE